VEGKGKEREEVERWGNASSLQGDKGPWKMTVVTVGKNTVEQTVISFAAQVGERRQIGRLKPATLTTADESFYSLGLAKPHHARARAISLHQLGDDHCSVD